MKILLLEDELMLQSSIYEYLDTLGYKVICFSDGLEAQKDLNTNEYDLLILDINVPNINGVNLIENLHKRNIFTPTIFISADVDIDTITTAFSLGAIDYLKKPFHLKELSIRIQKEMSNIKANQTIHVILSKNYEIDLTTSSLYFNKKLEILTNKRLKIIEYLAKNINSVVTIDRLRECIWKHEPVSDATIRTEINRLKKDLKENFIQNIKGVGYMICNNT